MSADGVEKGAILLMSLGEEVAASICQHLGPREVQKLGQAMAGLKNVTRESIGAVIQDFRTLAGEKTTVGLDSLQYVRNVLTKALGNEKAGILLDRILNSDDTSGIEGLKWMDSATVADLIKNEHPQIIATILVHLERDQASEILGFMTDSLRADVLLRIATLDGIRPTALKELNDVLGNLLAGGNSIKKKAMGGVRTVAEILNFTSGGSEGPVMDAIREHNADLAQKILDEMFVFENLLEVDDRGIQLVLREVQSDALIIALKGASEELRTKILKNMSSRAAETLKEDLESKGPVRLSEVEAQQKEILQIVRKLADDGQIALGGQGDDQFV